MYWECMWKKLRRLCKLLAEEGFCNDTMGWAHQDGVEESSNFMKYERAFEFETAKMAIRLCDKLPHFLAANPDLSVGYATP